MPRKPHIHEDLSRESEVTSSSDRSFGVVMTVVFSAIGLWPLLETGDVRLWSLIVAGGFALLALVRPVTLAPLNRAWFKFSLLLGRVVTPIVMAIIFFLVVTPTGLLMRVFGKYPLRLKFEPQAKTYWIDREPPGPAPETMRNQF